MIALARHMLVLCILLLTCGSHTVCCGAMEQDPPKPSATESMHVQGQTITDTDGQLLFESFGDTGEGAGLEYINRKITPGSMIRPWLIGVRNNTPNRLVLLLGLGDTALTGLQLSLGLDGLHVDAQWDHEEPGTHEVVFVPPGGFQAFTVPLWGTGLLTAAYSNTFGEVRALCVNHEVQAGVEYQFPAEQEGGSVFIGLVWFWPLCALVSGALVVRWSVYALLQRTGSKRVVVRC